MKKVFCLLPILFLFFISCGSNDMVGEDYGDILGSPSGLELTPHEHKHGWGKSECNLCHNFSDVHVGDNPDFDMTAVRELVNGQGVQACPTCHGTNGINGPTCASCHSGNSGD